MAHFAQLGMHDLVVQVIVVNNETINNLPFPESEPLGVEFCKSIFGADTNWKQTSFNGNFRKNYAGVNYVYDSSLDAFVAPQPYPSWILNTETAKWEAPTPYPDDGKVYDWNEDSLSWVLVDLS